MKMTLRYLKPYKGEVIGGLILKIVGTFSELFLPVLLDYMVDVGVPSKNVKLIVLLGCAMLFFSVTAMLGNIFANKLVAHSSGKMTRDLRQALFEKITYMPSSGVDAFTIPSLVSRLTSDTYYVNQTVARTLRMGIRAPILLTGGLIFTFVLDWRLALVLLACLPFVIIASVIITKKSVASYNRVQKGGDEVVRAMQENISGVRVVKALSKTSYENQKFEEVNDNLTSQEFKAAKVTSLTNPLATLVLNVGLVGVIALGAYLSVSGGTLLAFLSYFVLMLNAILGISKIFVVLARGLASSSRIEKVFASCGALPVKEYPEGDSKYSIEFKDVSFSYNGKKDNLQSVSFGVQKGQTVGVIGGTGSGKTTLINLLMRFYEVGGGAVYIDGNDVRSYEMRELRSKFGCVFQNDFLIADTIKQNVEYFRDIPEANYKKALRSACAEEIILERSEGDNYVLAQKGADLSGGQKQRLLIARALAGDPEILVLDDSSSALDYATDAKVRKALATEYSECTKFIVAQRVSAVKNSDLILVLNDGEVVGRGTHEQLFNDCEEYRRICEAQMGGVA
ncbi:MAG: ABC transporter ATP-binding protein [Candidatus Coproplasma sp.]